MSSKALQRFLQKLKGEKKDAAKEETIQVLPIDFLIAHYDSAIQRLDKMAGSRRNKRAKDKTIDNKIAAAASVRVSTIHYLKELAILKHLR